MNFKKNKIKSGRLSVIVDDIEETFIAILLAAMVIITFINVVLRYGFNSGLIWGLELVTYLFAWLVLFGISYAVKNVPSWCRCFN